MVEELLGGVGETLLQGALVLVAVGVVAGCGLLGRRLLGDGGVLPGLLVGLLVLAGLVVLAVRWLRRGRTAGTG